MEVLINENTNINLFNPAEMMTMSIDDLRLDVDQEEMNLAFFQDWDNEDQIRNKRIQKLFPSKYQKKSFKYAIRQGISRKQRHQVYQLLCEVNQKFDDFKRQWNIILTENSTPISDDLIFLFGFPDYELNAPREYLQNFLTIFKNQIKENIFSPMIPCIASILSISLKPEAAYFVLKSMYDQGNKYFTKTKREFAILLKTVEHSLSFNSHLFRHAKSLKVNFSEISLFLMPLLFSKRVDKRISLTIFDSFIYEGKSTLIRYIVGIIISLQSKLLQTNSDKEFMGVILDYVFSLNNPSKMNQLIEVTFSERHTKRKKITGYLLEQEEKLKKITDSEINQMIESPLPTIEKYNTFHHLTPLFGPHVRSLPHFYENQVTINNTISPISKVHDGVLMNNLEFNNLKALLPFYLRKYNAYSIYRMSVDGSSINSFLKKCRNEKLCILTIKTKSKTIGAVTTTPLSLSYHGTFKGSDTYVFDLTNNIVYRKSMKNDYCISVQNDSITIGLGDSGSAIYIDQYFTRCFSSPCETFNSPPLLSPNSKENILDIEVFRLGV